MDGEINTNEDEILDWVYWTSLQTIFYQDAASLICGVDPINPYSESGNNRSNLFSEKKSEIIKITKQIEAEIRSGKEKGFNTPWDWVCWAESKGLTVTKQFHELAYKAKVESIHVHKPQPLERISEESLAWYMKQDSWAYYEAIFLMHGYRPPGDIEGFDEVRSHFPAEYLMLERGLATGVIGKEIKQYGQKNFIDTPERWMKWGKDKGFDLDVINDYLGNIDYTDSGCIEIPDKGDSSIPGKIPTHSINRIAVEIAWEMEQLTGRRISAEEVFLKLKLFSESGEKYSHVLLPPLEGDRRLYVRWSTTNSNQRNFSIEACEKTLGRWHKSRQ